MGEVCSFRSVPFFWKAKMLNEGSKVDGGKYDSEKVIHWLDGKDVLARELFFFPFNTSNNHSILAVANLKQRVVFVYDSMGYNSVATPSWKNHEKLKLLTVFNPISEGHVRQRKECSLPPTDEGRLGTPHIPRQTSEWD